MVLVATSVGWVGAAGTVGAYALVSQHRLDAHSLRFQLINVVGAGLLAVSAMSSANWPSTMSNLLWMSFGAHALLRNRQALRVAAVDRWRRRGHRAPVSVRSVPSSSGDLPSSGIRDADEVTLAA
jgi:hypothetical protein